MRAIQVSTRRGVRLDGALFSSKSNADTVVIAITGIHGNFHSNPMYYNIGYTLAENGIDFIYAQTNDAYGRIETYNDRMNRREVIGSYNENFDDAEDDIEAYLHYAKRCGYRRMILAGHSLGANKVIRYLSLHPESETERFILMSPADLTHMTRGVSEGERAYIRHAVKSGRGGEILPFLFMGWLEATANTAYQWLFESTLNNAHANECGDFSQVAAVRHEGDLVIGTHDMFIGGPPARFLERLNSHMPTAKKNRLHYIENTGHTYRGQEQVLAECILRIARRRAEKGVAFVGRTCAARDTVDCDDDKSRTERPIVFPKTVGRDPGMYVKMRRNRDGCMERSELNGGRTI